MDIFPIPTPLLLETAASLADNRDLRRALAAYDRRVSNDRQNLDSVPKRTKSVDTLHTIDSLHKFMETQQNKADCRLFFTGLAIGAAIATVIFLTVF